MAETHHVHSPSAGRLAIRPNTWHPVELYVHCEMPEWDGQRVRFVLE